MEKPKEPPEDLMEYVNWCLEEGVGLEMAVKVHIILYGVPYGPVIPGELVGIKSLLSTSYERK